MKLINTYSGSYPIVFHAPGASRQHEFWIDMVARMESLQPVVCAEDIEVITWSSYDQPTLLEKCCETIGVPLTVLRPQAEWRNIQKVHLLVDHLESSTAKYVLALDADDVILTDSPDEVLRRWQENYPATKMLYNGAYRRWPRKFCKPCHPCDHFERKNFKGHAKHLNAGAWIGERTYALELYKEVQAFPREEKMYDIFWGKEQPSVRACVYPNHYPNVMIDTDSIVFQHMQMGVTACKHTADYTEFADNLVYYDCGAFDGKTTLNFVRTHKPARAYAIEPFSANMSSPQWTALHTTNVVSVNAACWTDYADMTFYRGDGANKSQGGTLINSKDNVHDSEGITVSSICFSDYFMQNYKSTDYTVVKMDIEGAEYDVLQQMMDTGVLSLVNELRIEFHGHKIAGSYDTLEQTITTYCADNNINLIRMDH